MTNAQREETTKLHTKLWKVGHFIILLSSLLLILASILLRAWHQVLADALQTFGVALFSIFVAYLLHETLEGEPIIRSLRKILSEDLQSHLREVERLALDIDFISEANEIGLKRVYKKRSDAEKDIISDIKNSSKSCKILAAVYFAEIQKPGNDNIVPALIEACKTAKLRDAKYHILYCSLPPSDTSLDATNRAILECWAKKEGGKSVDYLSAQIGIGTRHFRDLTEKVNSATGGALLIDRLYFRHYLVPHAALVIDDSIVYLAPYDWYHSRGTSSLALRLEAGTWSDYVVKETDIVIENFTTRHSTDEAPDE